ncbi:MAG: SGNH/GDSL hydrolase family protein [Oxalobacteraceae bacterium]|nr:MAG: SGNH/GDSL hydrolase family protein [Oxalobacteraceae bacterium]
MFIASVSRTLLGLYLVLGDSISSGVGVSRPQAAFNQLLVHNDAATYPSYVDRDLQSAGGAQVQQVNLAASGATAHASLQALRTWVNAQPRPVTDKQVLVTLTVGGNDLKNALAAAPRAGGLHALRKAAASQLRRTIDDLDAIADILTDAARFPKGVRLLVANIYDPSDGRDRIITRFGPYPLPGFAKVIAEWNAAYAAWATKRQVTLIDAHAAFLGHGYVYSPGQAASKTTQSYFADPLHPNDQGHAALRTLFWDAIAAP